MSARQVQEAIEAADIPSCDKHPREHVSMYCDTCGLPICTVCCLSRHKDHSHHELAEVAKELRADVASSVRSAVRYSQKLQKEIAELESADEKLTCDMDNGRQLVDRTAEALMAVVRQKQSKMQEAITLFETEMRKSLSLGKKQRQLQVGQTDSLCSYAESLGSLYNVTVHGPGVTAKLEEVQSAKLAPILQWQCTFSHQGKPSAEMLLPLLGSVTVEHTGTRNLLGEKEISVSLPATSRINLSCTKFVTGLSLISGRVYTVHWKDERLWVHKGGACVGRAVLKELKDPQGLALLSRDSLEELYTLVITDFSGGRLHFLSVTKEHEIKSQNIVKPGYKPWGVTAVNVGGRKNILVASPEERCIVVHDEKGTTIQTIQLSDMAIKSPICATPCSGGYLVADRYKNCVKRVTEAGKVVGSYSGEYLQLAGPWQIVTDRTGNVLVIDAKRHRIHLISPQGVFLKYLLTEKDGLTQEPTRLFLCEETRHLVVAHGSSLATYNYNYEAKCLPCDPKHLVVTVSKLGK